jgi:hypothetical protein
MGSAAKDAKESCVNSRADEARKAKKKLESNLSQLSAENPAKP